MLHRQQKFQSALHSHSCAWGLERGFLFPMPAIVEDLPHPVTTPQGNASRYQQAQQPARTLGSQVEFKLFMRQMTPALCILSVLI